MYAALDVSPNERHNFYKHMGHSALINESIYQAPLAEVEVTHVGRVLEAIEGSATDRQSLQFTHTCQPPAATTSTSTPHAL